MTFDRSPVVHAAGEVDREHDAGEHVQSVGSRAGERRGLAAGTRRIPRSRVVESDHVLRRGCDGWHRVAGQLRGLGARLAHDPDLLPS